MQLIMCDCSVDARTPLLAYATEQTGDNHGNLKTVLRPAQALHTDFH